MSIKRSPAQLLFESWFTLGTNPPFHQVPKSMYLSTTLTQVQAQQLHSALGTEVTEYYYKSILSLIEAIEALREDLYSWTTVKLYYSAYYSTKAYLLLYDYAILRAERRLYYIKARPGEAFVKCTNTTDHKAAFELLCKFFPGDYLLSNTVDSISAYDWIMSKREEVNYRDISFHEPNPPEFWETINHELCSASVLELIDRLVHDSSGLYCFQADYAILGVPLKRLELTVSSMKAIGLFTPLSEDRRSYISNLLTNYPISLTTSIMI